MWNDGEGTREMAEWGNMEGGFTFFHVLVRFGSSTSPNSPYCTLRFPEDQWDSGFVGH
jgi:hypothetical protein